MIRTKTLLTLSVAALVTSCASQSGNKAIAYRNFESGDYIDAIAWIRRAESKGSVTPALEAELAYLEARSLEGMGEYDRSEELYTYLAEQHPKSRYGYLARGKLERDAE